LFLCTFFTAASYVNIFSFCFFRLSFYTLPSSFITSSPFTFNYF
jgi:hypothetical protein